MLSVKDVTFERKLWMFEMTPKCSSELKQNFEFVGKSSRNFFQLALGDWSLLNLEGLL